jgi:hypothetical protein
VRIPDPDTVPPTLYDVDGLSYANEIYVAWAGIYRGKVRVMTDSLYPGEWDALKDAVPEPRRILIGFFTEREEADQAAREYYVALPLKRRAEPQIGSWPRGLDWDSTSLNEKGDCPAFARVGPPPCRSP